jgi:hypothetical protein
MGEKPCGPLCLGQRYSFRGTSLVPVKGDICVARSPHFEHVNPAIFGLRQEGFYYCSATRLSRFLVDAVRLRIRAVGSIPIARSITHDVSIALTRQTYLNLT